MAIHFVSTNRLPSYSRASNPQTHYHASRNGAISSTGLSAQTNKQPHEGPANMERNEKPRDHLVLHRQRVWKRKKSFTPSTYLPTWVGS